MVTMLINSINQQSPVRVVVPPVPINEESPVRVVIRQVWKGNLLEEFNHIGKLIHDEGFRYVSLDTEFPGCIFHPHPNPNTHYKVHPIYQYNVIKKNVDLLNLIQLGLTLSDSDGNLPNLDGETFVVWQFNFNDFNIYYDRRAQNSIDLLKKQGTDFQRNLSEGINSAHFAALMYHYKLVLNNDITWITFHSAYDFGYLVKILTGCLLPHALPDFLYLVSHFFGQNVYDMKYLMGFFPGLYGGLESLASSLQIVREVGLSHQSGSDSLLTLRTFQKIRLTYFESDEKELRKFVARAITQVVIREVWRENLLEEFQLIGKLIHDRYRYISFDTEFPGCVFRPPTIPNRHYKIHPIDQYRLIKQNVDILNLIQLGLTLTDSDGNFPDLGGQTSVVWQFNFCDFDINRHRCAHDSIDLLKKQGIDFERNLTHGINSAHFANLMYHYRLVFNSDITWITFHSAYDFGYLVKILTGCFLPHHLPDFLYLVRYFFGQNVYDMKYMMGFFPGLYGGLESLAGTLQIVREVGLSHQAGSDSLLTWRTFQKMRLTCFDSDEKELRKYGDQIWLKQ
ncbi:hypothetical protein G4B88_020510 [Cannabis sativa]|uniref:poly(A)-specific ribonuclease n=1 Tax=Cannabis sativa TaxID=3483 RepID=A0A7J6FTZ6_CANSA|nr:hypothetical protein G4B88_020510 [Cannabis sativa]